MRMHLLPAGRLRLRLATFVPDAPREQMVELPVSCALLRHTQGTVLVDTGCHPSVIDDAAARWGRLARFMTPVHGADETVPAQLAALGLQTGDVDVVVCSHLHPDHCGCNAFFPRATIICHRKELAAAEAPGNPTGGYLPVEWQRDTPMQLIDGEHDLFGDGRVLLLPMPGHTPGMVCTQVSLDRDGAFLLASDAVSVKSSLDRDYAPLNTWNVDALLASLADIRRIEAGGATVLCGHDAAQWQTLRKGAACYE